MSLEPQVRQCPTLTVCGMLTVCVVALQLRCILFLLHITCSANSSKLTVVSAHAAAVGNAVLLLYCCCTTTVLLLLHLMEKRF
jgi:hypothetical protein